jgi:hypothetical protein
MAISFGLLGFLLGRWSLLIWRSDPDARTAALIAAVAEETRRTSAAIPGMQAPLGVAGPSAPQAPSSPPPASGAATGFGATSSPDEPRSAPGLIIDREAAGQSVESDESVRSFRPLETPGVAPNYQALRNDVLGR